MLTVGIIYKFLPLRTTYVKLYDKSIDDLMSTNPELARQIQLKVSIWSMDCINAGKLSEGCFIRNVGNGYQTFIFVLLIIEGAFIELTLKLSYEMENYFEQLKKEKSDDGIKKDEAIDVV